MDEKEIFRKEAIEEQFSFKRLDQTLVVIPMQRGYLYFALFLLLLLFAIWCVFGSIPVTVSGKGVVLDLDQLTTIMAQEEGVVEEMEKKTGDTVSQGSLLVSLYNPLIFYEYEFTLRRKEQESREYETLLSQVSMERSFRDRQLDQQLYTIELAKKSKQEEIAIWKSTLEAEQNLLDKNILTLPTVNNTRLALLKAESEFQAFRAEILKIKFEKSQIYRETEIWDKERLLKETELKLGLLQKRLDLAQVKAPKSGMVAAAFVYPGAQVKKGDPLITLQSEVAKIPLEFYAFIPATEAKGIQAGMEARIELEKFIFKKYGYIYGKVKEVSLLPATNATILAKLFNPKLVETFQENSVTQVRIALERDPETPTGLRWTSGQGPQEPISIGNLGSATIVVDSIAPIYFLLPNWGIHSGESR
jgi:HlyD family secretion protein